MENGDEEEGVTVVAVVVVVVVTVDVEELKWDIEDDCLAEETLPKRFLFTEENRFVFRGEAKDEDLGEEFAESGLSDNEVLLLTLRVELDETKDEALDNGR